MLSKKIIAITFALFTCCSVALANEIKIANSEYWYGIEQGQTLTIDSKNRAGEPSFLISNKGRYIYSTEPFDATLTPKSIIINREGVKVEDGGKSLRDAYLLCCHRNFAPQNQTIATELYTEPIYDLRGQREYNSMGGDLVGAVERLVELGWPKGIILLGDEWQTLPGSYELDREYYKELGAQIGRVQDSGFKVIISITPYVAASGRYYSYAAQNGMLLMGSDGKPTVVATDHHGYAALYDPSSEQVMEMLLERVASLVEECGVDGIFTDCGEAARGSINSEEDIFIKAWNGICDKVVRPLNIRSNHADHYTPSITTFKQEDVIDSSRFLYDYLKHGFMYMPFNNQALVCGSMLDSESDLMLYLQNTSLTAMCLIPMLPQNIEDKAVLEACKRMVDQRLNLSSYILQSINQALLTGEPLLRSLEYIYPRQGFYDCYDQYMLGDDYMVVPVSSGETARTVRFPRGTWHSASGLTIKGPVVKSINIVDGEALYFSRRGNGIFAKLLSR